MIKLYDKYNKLNIDITDCIIINKHGGFCVEVEEELGDTYNYHLKLDKIFFYNKITIGVILNIIRLYIRQLLKLKDK